MNKKSVLEALKDLREDAKNHLPEHTKYLNERLDIIETALNDYFVYKQDYERVMKEKNSLLKEYAKSQKEHKALEIIKEKPLVALIDYHYNTYEEWLSACSENSDFENFDGLLIKTQEEYNLLKEVLL